MRAIIKRFWWVGLIVLVISAALIVLLTSNSRDKKNGAFIENTPIINKADDSKKMENPTSSLPECTTTKELFTIFPVKEGEYSSITPLGNLNPTGHTFPTDHIYVQVADPQHPEKNTVNVAKSLLAPADMWITSIQTSEEVGGITDYAMNFSPCKDAIGKFGHVGSISAALKTEMDKTKTSCNEYATGGHTYRSCNYDNLKIPVKAGEKIGTAGSERSGMLDIWMSDYREPPVTRANPSRWYSDRNYVSCFLDYYPTTQKTSFYGLLREPKGGIRTKEPRCGTVEVDIAGTAQGVWFYNLTGQIQGEDQHLALAYDNMETDKQVFSVGTSANNAGIPSGAYQFIPRTEGKVNRDFSQVSADRTIYCYDSSGPNGNKKSILLTMPTVEKLRLQKAPSSSCGNGPWTMTIGFVEYDR